MSWSNIAELRGLVETEISDSTLQDILDIAQRYIESKIGVQTVVSNEVQTAHLFKAVALTLRRMKTNGELPYMSKLGSAQQYNEIDNAIKMYDAESIALIRKYTFGVHGASVGSMYMRAKCRFTEDVEYG
jgi:hypothetical protein